jgi:prepilin-type N-terminal cleavage/methylation domain-containing protein
MADEIRGSYNYMQVSVCSKDIPGFSFIELMMAIAVLTFGLLAAGQLFYVAASSGSLANAKGTAAIAAQNMLEYLSDLYMRDASADDLLLGNHGPLRTQTANPVSGAILNRYAVSWNVSRVSDPRPGKDIDARLIRITVSPIQADGSMNSRPSFNKILNISTILSATTRWQAPLLSL